MGRRVWGVGLGIVVRILGLVALIARIVGRDARRRLGLATRCGEVGDGTCYYGIVLLISGSRSCGRYYKHVVENVTRLLTMLLLRCFILISVRHGLPMT
jgi:uncharacterized protein (DUF983 family)